MADNKKRLSAVRRFAASCHYEREHAEQVTRLAEMLFDALQPVHQLDAEARFWLTCAGLLHDIGWIDGQQGHHKASMRMILDDQTLPLDPEERAIVALIARYHRKALPRDGHNVYAELNARRRGVVNCLAALLRLADGLDRSHLDAVLSLDVAVGKKKITIVCRTRGPAGSELHYGKVKADLFERVFGCLVVLTCAPQPSGSVNHAY